MREESLAVLDHLDLLVNQDSQVQGVNQGRLEAKDQEDCQVWMDHKDSEVQLVNLVQLVELD